MELQFLGGARMVTGSCFYLNTGKLKILVECGAFQGSREIEELNYEDFPFDATEIDYVFLTHAHYDHVGRTPLLVKRGFRGKIFCTAPTKELARIIFLIQQGFKKKTGHVLIEEIIQKGDGKVVNMKRANLYSQRKMLKIL